MSDFKDNAISELSLLAAASIATEDLLPIVDVSSTAAGETKRTTINDLTTAVVTIGNITTQGNTFNAANKLVKLDENSALANAIVVASNLTTQGNSFNGADELVQLNESGELPGISGALLTSLNASSINSGTLSNARLSANVTLQGNTFNGNSQLVQLNSNGQLPGISGILLTNLNASSINSGTLADARLSANVTLQGNTFNAPSKLVQLDANLKLPMVNGENLTDLNASSINSGSLSDSVLSPNVALKTKQIVALPSPTVQILSDLNKDAIFVVGHGAGVVNFNLPNDPITSAGVSFTIITNTVQAISFTCDTLATAYYVNAGGTGTTLSPGATLSPGNQRGRVITVTCINTNTYVISGAAL